MERMSTLDAGFFFVEHKNVPMHLGSLMVFEGPAPPTGISGPAAVGGVAPGGHRGRPLGAAL